MIVGGGKIMITSEEIKRRLWDGANELRGSMDASRYKDYMLGLMFYKFLSDKTLETFRTTAGLKGVSEEKLIEEYFVASDEHGEDLFAMLQNVLGYYVLPEYLYQTWLKYIDTGDFEVSKVTDSLNNFERTIAKSNDSSDFSGLFSSSNLDLTDTALGSNLNERSKNIKALILLFADLNMVALQKGDVLGDAYEYLIGQFAMESGKKAGEFYTPRQVSEVMAQIVSKNKVIKTIYDPTVGSGSLLLTVKKHLSIDAQKDLNYYGQEKNTATYNLTRMNLLLHGVRPEKMTIKNGDTLDQDWPEDPERPNEGVQFDAVVMNPPYSAKNWNRAGLRVSDPRFEIAGVLPPDSKGDYAFLLHGLFHLGPNGTMAIVLPHGVLFRGAAEGEIRKRLLNKNYIDSIIGLPSNLFTNTGIPVVVIILKKNRKLDEPVLVIDASKNFVKVGKQNVLLEKDIAKIVDTFLERKSETGYSSLLNRDEILKNDYNLNIPRYVSSNNEEIPHDVEAHLYGGIPYQNIENLVVLQTLVPDIMERSLRVIREGYVELIFDLNELETQILNDDRVIKYATELRNELEAYVTKYWDILKSVDKSTNVASLMEGMLEEIKSILSEFTHIDVYDGYQVIAEIWKNALLHDIELIQNSEFYTVARSRIPNLIIKGSGNSKREEQDGWVGSLISIDSIAKHLFDKELKVVESKKTRLIEVDSELTTLAELAKEESDESNPLLACLKLDENDEPLDVFDGKLVKTEFKNHTKDSEQFKALLILESLINEKNALNKEIKDLDKTIIESAQQRILKLTNEEIEFLMFDKWFGKTVESVVELLNKPIKKELNTLKSLSERYNLTLSVMDNEIRELEKELEDMMSELVLTS